MFMVDLSLEELYDLLEIWWDLYRIINVSDSVTKAFDDLVKICPMQVLDIATILHKSLSPNTSFVMAIVNGVAQSVFDNIPLFKSEIFVSETEFEEEKKALIEELRAIVEKIDDIYYVKYIDENGKQILS